MRLRSTTTGSTGGRPQIMATRGVVSSGHYLATDIGLDTLKRGGNAADAALAIRITSMPITAEKVALAVKAGKAEQD